MWTHSGDPPPGPGHIPPVTPLPPSPPPSPCTSSFPSPQSYHLVLRSSSFSLFITLSPSFISLSRNYTSPQRRHHRLLLLSLLPSPITSLRTCFRSLPLSSLRPPLLSNNTAGITIPYSSTLLLPHTFSFPLSTNYSNTASPLPLNPVYWRALLLPNPTVSVQILNRLTIAPVKGYSRFYVSLRASLRAAIRGVLVVSPLTCLQVSLPPVPAGLPSSRSCPLPPSHWGCSRDV